MGGNTKAIDRTTGKVVNFMGRPGYADKVDFRQIDRTTFRADVIATIKRLDGLHEESYGEPIWDPRKINSLLSSGAAFNGSSEHLFNSKISDEDFTRYKSQVGDIDLTIPAERAETLFELLGTLEQSPILPGKVWYVGQNKKSHSGEQINSLFAYKFDPDAPPLFFQRADLPVTPIPVGQIQSDSGERPSWPSATSAAKSPSPPGRNAVSGNALSSDIMTTQATT